MVEQVDAERKRIPLGQPHLIGHHSYNRTVRAEEKRNAKEQRGLEHIRRGRRWAGRADAAAGFQTGREALGTTLRRIERLEAEIRALTRYLAGTFHQWEITVTTDWTGDYGKTLDERLAARPQGAHVVSRDEDRNLARVFIPLSPTARAATEAQIILLGEEVDHWKAHAAAVQEKDGVAYTMRSAGASVSPGNLTPVSLTATDVAAPACGIGDRNAQRPARYRTSRGSLRAAQPRLTAQAPAPGCCDRRRSATGRPASRRPRSRSPYAGRPEPRSRRRTGWRIR
jgi:Domain of unknown function (DUF3560)